MNLFQCPGEYGIPNDNRRCHCRIHIDTLKGEFCRIALDVSSELEGGSQPNPIMIERANASEECLEGVLAADDSTGTGDRQGRVVGPERHFQVNISAVGPSQMEVFLNLAEFGQLSFLEYVSQLPNPAEFAAGIRLGWNQQAVGAQREQPDRGSGCQVSAELSYWTG